MRIISGNFRGKKIHAPQNLPVRPTTDFAKEGLFNILNNRIDLDRVDVLDLFAGTGNISYEFASREAKSITAIDADKNCIAFIKRTAEELDFDQIRTIHMDVFKMIKKEIGKFDIIFADPPFGLENTEKIPDMILENGLLNENGYLILEHPKEIKFENHPNLVLNRKFGHVNFSFFQLEK